MAIDPRVRHERKRQDIFANAVQLAKTNKLEREKEFGKIVTELTRSKEDEKTELQQLASTEGGGTQFAIAAPPQTGIGDQAVAGHSTKLGNAFLNEEVSGGTTNETTTPGPSSGGSLPPRTLDISTTRTGEEKRFGGNAGLVAELFGVNRRPTSDTTSRKEVNPEFQQVMSDTQQNVAEMIFRVNNRDMRPDAFVKSLQGDLEGFTRQEKQLIMRGAQQQARLFTAAQSAKSKAAADTLMLGLIQDYPSLGSREGFEAVHGVAFARTPEESGKAHHKLGQLIFNSQEAKGGRSRQAAEDEIRRIQGETARLNLEEAKITAAFRTNKMKTVGVMTENGLTGTRNEDQVLQSIRQHTRNAKGEITITDENRGLIIQDQLDSLRLGLPVPLVQPGGLISGAKVHSWLFRDMEKFAHALQNRGFDSKGELTTVESEVDVKRTNKLHQQALDYFGTLGIKFDTNGEPFVPTDHPDVTALSRGLELLSHKEQLELSLSQEEGELVSIPTVYNFSQARKGVQELPPVQGPIAPATERREPLATPAAEAGRSFREFSGEALRRVRQSGLPVASRRGAAQKGKEQAGEIARKFQDFFEEANR